MTALDRPTLAFALAMGFWGYQQGLIVGLLSLGGFAIGAFLGSRLGPGAAARRLAFALRPGHGARSGRS